MVNEVVTQSAPPRVSILARIAATLPLWTIMLGAALCALLIMRVMTAMRYAEAAGIAAVAGGMAEANLPVLVSLYVAIFLMLVALILVVVRAFMTPETASPSGWWFLIVSVLGLIPLSLAWRANALLMQALFSRVGIVEVGSSIRMSLILTLLAAGLVGVVLLVSALVPLPPVLRGKRSWAPIVVLVAVEIVLIGLAVSFQLHMSELQQLRDRY